MKKVLLWGSEGGIGQAVLNKFRDQGWEAAAAARTITGRSAAAEWKIQADFREIKDLERAGAELADLGVAFDVFVFAAGDIASQKVGEGDPGQWKRILDNNLTAAYLTLQASLPVMKEDAAVILLGAVSERLRLPGLSAYAAAKAGLEALGTAFAKEARRKQVLVVRPGAVATGLWDKVPFKQPEQAYQPEQVADRIWEAYQQGETGQLDLT
jgi:NAD(P)-dependent dehydrogenase (short-subunit alcohol dehydrogenase family)